MPVPVRGEIKAESLLPPQGSEACTYLTQSRARCACSCLRLPHHPIVILVTCNAIRPGSRAGIYYNRSLTARRLHPWIFVPPAEFLNKAMLLLFSRLGAHTSARWGRRREPRRERDGIPFQHEDEQLQMPDDRERRCLGPPEPRRGAAAFRTRRTARPADSSAPSNNPFPESNVPVPRQNNARNTIVCPEAST